MVGLSYWKTNGFPVERIKQMLNNVCPKCSTEMHTNTIISVKPWKRYQECPSCNYKTKAK